MLQNILVLHAGPIKYIGELLVEPSALWPNTTKFSSGPQWPRLQWPPPRKEQP